MCGEGGWRWREGGGEGVLINLANKQYLPTKSQTQTQNTPYSDVPTRPVHLCKASMVNKPCMHASKHVVVHLVGVDAGHFHIVSRSLELLTHRLHESSGGKLGGDIVPCPFHSKQSQHGADGDNVTSIILQHVWQKSLHSLKHKVDVQMDNTNP